MKKSTTVSLCNIRSFILLFLYISCTQFSSAQTSVVKNKYPSTLLWRISGNGLSKPSYLYGTIHLTDKRLFYFGDSLYKAIEQTEGFAIEINPDELSTQLIQSFTKEDKSALLKDAVDKESYDRIEKKLEKKYGFKADRLTKRQAYLARNEWMKDMKKSDDMNTVMDAWLYNIARQMGKWTGGIEDLNDQLSLIEKDEADFSFEDLLIDKKIMQGGLNYLIDLYLSQDLQALDDFFNHSTESKKDEWLIKRNIKMAHRMDSLLRFRTHFFAIGAAHLPGDSGVIKLLLQKGFHVEPVFSSAKISPDDYKVEEGKMKWQSFIPTDSLYHVSFPSKSATMFISGNVVKMEMCIDIPTATYYITAAVPNMRQGTNKEKLIEEMLQGFTKGSKIIERKKISEDGQTGLEVLVEKEGFLRVRGFIKGNYAFMTVMGHETKKEMLKGEMAARFFSSFSVSDKALLISDGMKTFSNEESGFSILLPTTPELMPNEAVEEGWISKTYSSFDTKSNVYFMMKIKSTGPGYYLNGDSNYFDTQRQGWKTILKELKAEKYFNLGEFPVMQYDFMMEKGKEKAMCRSLTINRGNRSYLLLAVTEKDGEINDAIKVFFNSFQLIDYKKANWSTQQSPDGHFSGFTPAPVKISMKKDEDGNETGLYSYVSYDSLSAVSFELTKVSYVDYYHAETDSAAFYDAMYTQIGTTDSVLSKRYTMNGNDKSQDVIVRLKGNQNLRRMRLVLHNDTMYIAFALLQPKFIDLPEVNKYFDEIRVLTAPTGITIFKKKTKELLLDLSSGDSARFAVAAEQIDKINFGKEDLPFLKEALLKQYDNETEKHEGIYNTIADIIADLNDSSVVSFVKKKYFSPTLDNEAQKLAMLRLLALTKTKESYTVLKELILAEPPLVEYMYPLQSVISDSLQLTKILFPELMGLSSDSLFADFTADLANQLLDSSYITIASIKPFEKNLLLTCESIIEKLKADPETDVYSYDESLHLLGRLNSAEGNKLLQKIVLLKQKILNRIIITDLLLNKQTVPKEIIEFQAADKEYRFSFYYRLEENGLTAFFPSKYSTQKSIAESDVYNMASDEYEVEEIVYIREKVSEYDKEQKRFHLFKVKVEGSWYLGISGGYEMDSKIIHMKKGKDVGGIYWEEEFDMKKVNEQFEAYIKESVEEE
ncbi:MAG: TraB/GumN family protein [Chitinophagaceae bacterium]|nr:TraB/GumN family protein [Chitinophagaceae bacterium]